jgi:hypothetical protein
MVYKKIPNFFYYIIYLDEKKIDKNLTLIRKLIKNYYSLYILLSYFYRRTMIIVPAFYASSTYQVPHTSLSNASAHMRRLC